MTHINVDTFRVLDGAVLDESARRVEVHVHQPFVTTTTFNANDEIRIPIHQQDVYVLPHLSSIYIEGRFIKGAGGGNAALTNNALSFLFDDVRYEINGVEVDRTKNVGITSTLKGVVSLNEGEVGALENAGWTNTGDSPSHLIDANGNFNACIPGRILLGFLEDYPKILLNVCHELILTRSKNDRNAFLGNEDTRIELSKVHWRVPYVYPSDAEYLKLLNIVEEERTLQICFRSWELYEYPVLPQATKQTWAVKTATRLEKPRYVIVAFQTNRKANLDKDSSKFDHCNLTNVKLYLNSECFPYENLNLDFSTGKYALLYEMYENFQRSYYGKVGEPLYGKEQFKELAPIVVIDASKQSESIKPGPIDRRLEFESSENFPPNTTAYCLILHDRIVEYTPGNESVRRVKSNVLIFWTFGQAESSFYSVLDTALPAVTLFEGPLHTIDKILCKSLDVVEQRVPIINQPPEMIYWNTKQYVSDMGTKIVRPVWKRADSVKQIGNSVLASKYTAFAADTLDGALNVADKYVDKYLPADSFDEQGVDEVDVGNNAEGPAGKAIQTIHHVDRFSRKLQRRLTRRTLAEAKALKEQSAEAIHVLLYVAELVATDPKLALQKGRELWASLSKDEPENQARPENLEQLIVLLTRESARTIVHLINFANTGLSKLPQQITNSFHTVTNVCLQVVHSILKTIHLEKAGGLLIEDAKARAQRLAVLLKYLNTHARDLLESLAQILASQLSEAEQSKSSSAPSATAIANRFNSPRGPRDTLHPPASPKSQLKAAHRYANNANIVNGVESN